MPIISYFFGIYIRMYHDDHNPPHIHVEYQEQIMIKIIQAEYLRDKVIQLHFSDGSYGDYDLLCLINRKSELTKLLQDETFVKQFYLEMGALCWPNGLELSPGSIHRKLQVLQDNVKIA